LEVDPCLLAELQQNSLLPGGSEPIGRDRNVIRAGRQVVDGVFRP
jgi:hypothetical protein